MSSGIVKYLKFQVFQVMPAFELQAFHKIPRPDAPNILACLLLPKFFPYSYCRPVQEVE